MILPKLHIRQTVAPGANPKMVQPRKKGTCWGLACSLDMKVTESPCQVEPSLLSSSPHLRPSKNSFNQQRYNPPSSPCPCPSSHTQLLPFFSPLTFSAPLFPKTPLSLSCSFPTMILKSHLIKQSTLPSTPRQVRPKDQSSAIERPP